MSIQLSLPNKYYRGIRSIERELTPEEHQIINDLIVRYGCNFTRLLNAQHRIGSESMMGKVFEVEVSNIVFALKIVTGRHGCQPEFSIAKHLEEETTFDSHKYFLYSLFCLQCTNIMLGNTIFNGSVLGMELAVGDLVQMLENAIVTEDRLAKYLNQIIKGIFVMARSNVFHGDLHPRNTFIVMHECKLRAVIGDFGSAELTEPSETSVESEFMPLYRGMLEILPQSRYDNLKRKLTEVNEKLMLLSREIMPNEEGEITRKMIIDRLDWQEDGIKNWHK